LVGNIEKNERGVDVAYEGGRGGRRLQSGKSVTGGVRGTVRRRGAGGTEKR